MKVQVLQEDLNRALNICNRFSSTRVQLPVLSNVLLQTTKNKLRIVSTNLEVSASVSIGAKITEEGSITVPSRIITELTSNLKTGQVDLISEKESFEIKAPDFQSKLTGMNSSDFPNTPSDVGAESFKIVGSEFHKSLSKVLFSVSNDETRPVLTGVLMIVRDKELIFVTTDGFRLSQKKIKFISSSEEKRIIVPRNTLSELIRISGEEDVEFSFKKAENQVVFGVDNIVLATRTIEGDFPDFERIIPKDTKIKVSLDKEEFLRSIKLASVFAKDSANVIKIGIEKDYLEINAESQQYGSQKGKLDAKISGASDEKFTIAFNYRFLEEFLNAVESDDVQMELSDPNSPVLLIDPKDTSYLHIIMPVRIQS